MLSIDVMLNTPILGMDSRVQRRSSDVTVLEVVALEGCVYNRLSSQSEYVKYFSIDLPFNE